MKLASSRTRLAVLVPLLVTTRLFAWIPVGEAENSTYLPFPGIQPEARIQFMIPAEDIQATGMLEAIEFRINSAGAVYDDMEIVVSEVPAPVSFGTSFFDTNGRVPFFQGTYVDLSPPASGWVRFQRDPAREEILLLPSYGLFVELKLRTAATGVDTQSDVRALSGGLLFAEGSSAWDATSGNLLGVVPVLRLIGPRRTLLGGTWRSEQEVHLDSDLILPAGETLVIQPGVNVVFDGSHSLRIDGDLQAIGLADAPIVFRPADLAVGWNGLVADDSDAVLQLAHCRFENYVGTDDLGNMSGAIHVNNAGALELAACRFQDGGGKTNSGLYCRNTDLVVRDLAIAGGYALEGVSNGLYVSESSEFAATIDGLEIEDSNFHQRSFQLSGPVTVRHGLLPLTSYIPGISGNVHFEACTFWRLGNSGNAMNVTGSGNEIVDCVFAGGDPDDPYMLSYTSTGLYIGHSLFQAQQSILPARPGIVEGAGVIKGASPQFVLWGTDFHLSATSPCIDAGDPISERDVDLTRADMGAFPYDRSVPVLSRLADVPADQGRQLQLVWNAGSMDVAELGEFGSYSVWREDGLFARSLPEGMRVLGDPAAILAAPADERSDLLWERTDGTVWSFVAQLPATRAAEYGFVAPTLQDSTAADANPSAFKVLWHCSTHLSESAADSASSVDNIAPDAVVDLAARASGDALALRWSPVTTGTLEGNAYPELGAIGYVVYRGDTPDFPCDEAHRLGTTSDPELLLAAPEGDAIGFFKVVATD